MQLARLMPGASASSVRTIPAISRPKKSKAPAIVAAVLAVLVVREDFGVGARSTLFNSCSAQSVELLAEGQEATITVAEDAGAKVVGEQLAEARAGFQCGRLHEARQRDGR